MTGFQQFLNEFINDENQITILFNEYLDSNQRKTFYELIESHNLYHKTVNLGNNKYIIVSKVKTDNSEFDCLSQFIKDFNCAIMPIDSDFIEYSLKKSNRYTNLWDIYENVFLPLILELGNNDIKKGLIIYRKAIIDMREKLVTDISNNSYYQQFLKTDIKSSNEYKISKKSIYCLQNSTEITKKHSDIEKKYYISIDLISANFSCCKLFDKRIVYDIDKWDDLICLMFEKINLNGELFRNFVKSNKHLRQLIFGQLNCKKIMEYSRSVMHKICDLLVSHGVIHKNDLMTIMHDEIIIRTDMNHFHKVDQIGKILANYAANIFEFCRIQSFNLHNLANQDFFVKRIIYDHKIGQTDMVNFKCIDSKYMNQCISYYERKTISDNDLRFQYDGYSARFDRSIFDEFNQKSKNEN